MNRVCTNHAYPTDRLYYITRDPLSDFLRICVVFELDENAE